MGNNSNATNVTYYNVGRSSTLQDDNVMDNKDIRIRTYKDFVKDNNSTKNSVERNRIYSRPEMGVGVSSSGSKARSSGNDVSRRYYTNPTNSSTGRPAKSTQYNWGLGGRNNYSGNSSNSSTRSYSNPGSRSSSSSTRSYNSSSSSYSRSAGPPNIGSSSSSSSSSSVRSGGRGSR